MAFWLDSSFQVASSHSDVQASSCGTAFADSKSLDHCLFHQDDSRPFKIIQDIHSYDAAGISPICILALTETSQPALQGCKQLIQITNE
jgi:hypothetical protein